MYIKELLKLTRICSIAFHCPPKNYSSAASAVSGLWLVCGQSWQFQPADQHNPTKHNPFMADAGNRKDILLKRIFTGIEDKLPWEPLMLPKQGSCSVEVKQLSLCLNSTLYFTLNFIFYYFILYTIYCILEAINCYLLQQDRVTPALNQFLAGTSARNHAGLGMTELELSNSF